MRKKRNLKQQIEKKQKKLKHYQAMAKRTAKELDDLKTTYNQQNDELFGNYMRGTLHVDSLEELKEKFDLVPKQAEESVTDTDNHEVSDDEASTQNEESSTNQNNNIQNY